MAGVCSISDDDIPRSVLKSARDADVPLELLGAANGLQEPDNELVERSMVTPAFFGEKIFPFMAKRMSGMFFDFFKRGKLVS